MITITLIYPDGREWGAGGFESLEAANAWLARARKQADWNPATVARITDNTPAAGT